MGTGKSTGAGGTGGTGGSAGSGGKGGDLPAACGATPVKLASGATRFVALDGPNVYAISGTTVVRHARSPAGEAHVMYDFIDDAADVLNLAAAGGKVFWILPENGGLFWMDGAAENGQPEILVATEQRALTTYGTTLYWCDGSGFVHVVEATNLTEIGKSPIVSPEMMAVDATYLYWVTHLLDLYRAPLPLAPQYTGMIIDQTDEPIMTSDATAYIWSRGDHETYGGRKGAATSSSDLHIHWPSGLYGYSYAAEDPFLYMLLDNFDCTQGKVTRFDFTDGNAQKDIVTGLDCGTVLALDEHNIYYGTASGLYCVSK